MSRRALIREARRRFKFRDPNPGEDGTAYLAALVDHVEGRDYAAAHELRLGKFQADWTRDEVQAFGDGLRSKPGPPEDFKRPPLAIPMLHVCQLPATDDAAVLTLARRTLGYLEELRRTQPTREIQIQATIVLTDGNVWATFVASRSDRLAVLKALAREQPVMGYVLGMDAYLHAIDTAHGTASKQDCLMVHTGTRTMRQMLHRPYRFAGKRRVTFDPAIEYDMLDPASPMRCDFDPYASIFVSVPAPERAQ